MKKIIGLAASVMALCLSYATATAADRIEVSYNGETINLSNASFVDNYEVYLPLREVLNQCDVSDDRITYDNGKITFSMYSPTVNENVTAEVRIGEQGITFDIDQTAGYVTHYSEGKRTTTHPVLLKNDVAYAPMGVFTRIKDLSLDLRSSNTDKLAYIDDFRYSRATRYDLLRELEVKQYTPDGQFDVLLSRPLDVKAENRSDPKTYYEDNERVIVGTPEEQSKFWPEYNEVNGYYYPLAPIKRIIVDEDGKTVAIVLVQNQKHETINRCDGDTFGASCLGVFHDLESAGGLSFTHEDKTYSTSAAAMVGENRDGDVKLYFYIPTALMVQPY